MSYVNTEWTELYDEFWDFMKQEHGLTLTDSEMYEILLEVGKLQEKLKKEASQNCKVKRTVKKP